MRIPILCAALLAAAHAATASAQPAPAPLPAGDGWVALTIADYLKLRDQANPRPAPPPPPPARATVSETAYELIAGEGLATGTAELAIDVLDDGWVEVPLPASLFVRAARLGGRPLPITDGRQAAGASPGVSLGSGTRRILLSRRGRSLVTLDVAVPIAETAGNEYIQLPPATGGLVRVTLTVPRADVAIVASGGTIIERAGESSTRRVTAHAAPGQALGLSWSRQRETAGASLPARLRGQLQHVIGLGEETALVTARITIEVMRGGTASFTLRVPNGLVINQVQGAHVADWDVQDGVLSITLLDRVDRQVAVIVSGEFRPPASGRIEVPLLHLADAERETGAVAVEVLGAGEVMKHEARGLDPTDPTDLGDLLSGRLSPAIVAFRYRGDRPDAERALALTLTRYAPQEVLLAAVDEARYRAIVSEDGKALVEGRLAVRNNQRSFLALTLPGDATLWSVAVDGRPVRPGTGPKGSVLVPLPKRRGGSEAARVIVGLMYADKAAGWGPSGEWRLTLPAIDLPVQQMGLTVKHSPRYRLTPLPSDFHAQAIEPPLSEVLQLDSERDARKDALLAGGEFKGRDQKAKQEAGAMGDGLREVARPSPDQPGPAPATAPVPVPAEQRAEAGPRSRGSQDEEAQSLGGLVERFQREARGVRSVGTLPVLVAFPDSGPGLYLAAALTADGAAPTAAFTFKRAVK
jgi:hypothetical protein